MGPKEIAKLMEDEDPSEVEFPFDDEKRAKNRRKRNIKRIKRKRKQNAKFQKDKEEYKVDKITGQPKDGGKILYSDIETEVPRGLTEAIDAKESAIHGMISLGREVSTDPSWNSGQTSYSAFKNRSDVLQNIEAKLYNLKTKLSKYYANDCRFLDELIQVQSMVDITKKSLAGKVEDMTYINFPPPGWWGRRSWGSVNDKRTYVNIFWGEVITAYFGKVLAQRSLYIRKYGKEQANEYMWNELVCGKNSKISLIKVFDNFAAHRDKAFAYFRGSKKVKKEKIPGLPPGDPKLSTLIKFQKELLKVLGKVYARSPLSRMISIYHRPDDMDAYTEQYLNAARSQFGSEIVDRLWQKVN